MYIIQVMHSANAMTQKIALRSADHNRVRQIAVKTKLAEHQVVDKATGCRSTFT